MRAVIFGCGYVGLELGRQLVAAGHEVFGVRRHPEAAAELVADGLVPLVADVADAASLAALPDGFDWVVNTVSSAKGDASVYRQVYLNGNRNLLAWLTERGCRRYAYTSSTSVYAQQDGGIVTEDSPTEPRTETGRVLVETERVWFDAHQATPWPAGIFRVAGIYGPGRGHLYQQFLRGEARITGAGNRLINMIHRDDVAGAVAAFLSAPDLPRGPRTFNAVDDEPITQLEFFQWLSARMNRPMPPRASDAEAAANKRGQTQKRVGNQRLRTEVGWVPRFPTFRAGYEALIGSAPRD